MKIFFNAREFSEAVGLSRQTISKMIRKGEIAAKKLGKEYKIPIYELSKLLPNNYSTIAESEIHKYCFSKGILNYPNKKNTSDILKIDGNVKYKEVKRCDSGNYFIFGDNRIVLLNLLKKYSGKVDLIYIDPPFGTGTNFNTIEDEHAYNDYNPNYEFLEFLRERLLLLRELLSSEGSIYLHIDKKIGHYVKIIMDEVFGYKNYINDITRIKCNPKNFSRKAYGNYSDMILYYAKFRDKQIWNDIRIPLTEAQLKRLFPRKNKQGRYTTHPLHAPGSTVNGETGNEWMGLLPPKGRHWRYKPSVLTQLNDKKLIEWSATGNPRKIVYASGHKGQKVQDIWEYKDKGLSLSEYPTQKNDKLLSRIIENSSHKKSIVLDCFAGFGTTLWESDKLGRTWIGIDNSPKSYDIIKSNILNNQISANILELIT